MKKVKFWIAKPDNGGRLIEIEGRLLHLHGFDFVVHRPIQGENASVRVSLSGYQISEYSTGSKFIREYKKQSDAIEHAKLFFTNFGQAGIDRIKKAIAVSPKVNP